jgi:hypothetical protein
MIELRQKTLSEHSGSPISVRRLPREHGEICAFSEMEAHYSTV